MTDNRESQSTPNPRFPKQICLVCDREYPATMAVCPDDKIALVPLKMGASVPEELYERYDELLVLAPSSGRSSVFKGRKKESGQLVAIKVPTGDATRFNAFARQISMLRALNHPAIVALLEFGQLSDGSPYYVTEYCSGQHIDQALNPFDVAQFLNVFLQITDAMQYAHDHNVFHWDLKPADVLVDASDRVKLLDFGKGMPWLHGDNYQQQRTELGDVFGDPGYIAPETCRFGEMNARSNIYSLGCIMYACLQGHAPVATSNWMAAAILKLDGKYIPLRTAVAKAVPVKLQNLIFKCMSVDPFERFASMAEVKQELENCRN